MSADATTVELGLELPPAPAPMGVYKPIVITGKLAYLSGHGPVHHFHAVGWGEDQRG